VVKYSITHEQCDEYAIRSQTTWGALLSFYLTFMSITIPFTSPVCTSLIPLQFA